MTDVEWIKIKFTEKSGKAEIAELHHAFLSEKDVFRFDVSVNAVVGVAIADGLQCLPDDPLRQHFRHSAISKHIRHAVHRQIKYLSCLHPSSFTTYVKLLHSDILHLNCNRSSRLHIHLMDKTHTQVLIKHKKTLPSRMFFQFV